MDHNFRFGIPVYRQGGLARPWDALLRLSRYRRHEDLWTTKRCNLSCRDYGCSNAFSKWPRTVLATNTFHKAYVMDCSDAFNWKHIVATHDQENNYSPNDWLAYAESIFRHLQEQATSKESIHDTSMRGACSRGGILPCAHSTSSW